MPSLLVQLALLTAGTLGAGTLFGWLLRARVRGSASAGNDGMDQLAQRFHDEVVRAVDGSPTSHEIRASLEEIGPRVAQIAELLAASTEAVPTSDVRPAATEAAGASGAADATNEAPATDELPAIEDSPLADADEDAGVERAEPIPDDAAEVDLFLEAIDEDAASAVPAPAVDVDEAGPFDDELIGADDDTPISSSAEVPALEEDWIGAETALDDPPPDEATAEEPRSDEPLAGPIGDPLAEPVEPLLVGEDDENAPIGAGGDGGDVPAPDDERSSELEAELAERFIRITELEGELRSRTERAERADMLEDRLRELEEAHAKELEEVRSEQETSSRDVSDRVAELEEELLAREEKVRLADELEARLEEASVQHAQRVEELEAEARRSRSDHARRVTQLEGQLADAHEQRARQAEELETALSCLADLEASLAAARDVHEVASQLSEVVVERDRLAEQVESLEAEQSQRNQEEKRLAQTLTRRTDELESIRARARELDQVRSERDRYRDVLEDLGALEELEATPAPLPKPNAEDASQLAERASEIRDVLEGLRDEPSEG